MLLRQEGVRLVCEAQLEFRADASEWEIHPISKDDVKCMVGVYDPEDWSPCSGCLFYKHLDDTNFNVTYCIPCAALHIVSSCFLIPRTVSEVPKPFDLRSLFRPTGQ